MANEKEKLIQAINDAIAQDEALREQFNIGNKFRFIRDRLLALSSYIETNLQELADKEETKGLQVGEDECLVYVYLFNAHGLDFQSWHKMLNASVFYEYSVNRPVYTDKLSVEAFIRSKTSHHQHAYLTVIVKKDDILTAPEGLELKDSLGNKLVKVREGTLQVKKLFGFTQSGNEYEMSGEGVLKKK